MTGNGFYIPPKREMERVPCKGVWEYWVKKYVYTEKEKVVTHGDTFSQGCEGKLAIYSVNYSVYMTSPSYEV